MSNIGLLSRSNKSHIIRNSPIEFVVSGPVGGRDRVLLRSEGASLDLTALSSQNMGFEHRLRRPDPLIALFAGRGRQINVVTSMTVPDFERDTDSRQSSLSFAWVGFSSPSQTEHIRKTFNQCIPDLLDALKAEAIEDIEFSVAPIVLVCSDANERRKMSRRAMYWILALYGVMGMAVFVYTTVNKLF